MDNKKIVIKVLLSVFTFGIYEIFWLVSLENEFAIISGRKKIGIKFLLLIIITLGVYKWFWISRIGRELESKGHENISSLYILLDILGLSLVNMILLQVESNRLMKNLKYIDSLKAMN